MKEKNKQRLEKNIKAADEIISVVNTLLIASYIILAVLIIGFVILIISYIV